jgi:hypothetical protein
MVSHVRAVTATSALYQSATRKVVCTQGPANIITRGDTMAIMVDGDSNKHDHVRKKGECYSTRLWPPLP